MIRVRMEGDLVVLENSQVEVTLEVSGAISAVYHKVRDGRASVALDVDGARVEMEETKSPGRLVSIQETAIIRMAGVHVGFFPEYLEGDDMDAWDYIITREEGYVNLVAYRDGHKVTIVAKLRK